MRKKGMSDLIFLCACAGATFILQSGKIFGWLHRRMSKTVLWCFWQCELCLGFWVGALLSMPLRCPDYFYGRFLPGQIFADACASALVCYVLGRVVSDEGLNIKVK